MTELITKEYKPKFSSFKATLIATPEVVAVFDKIAERHDFTAAFWAHKYMASSEPQAVRINHQAYWIGSAKKPGKWNGFSGRWFTIKFIDGPRKGEVVQTCDLWANGDIPEELHEVLPDNAVWGTAADILENEVTEG